jgi:hypothetical protein
MLIKLDEKEGSLERKKLDGGAHTERYNLMGEGYVHCQHLQVFSPLFFHIWSTVAGRKITTMYICLRIWLQYKNSSLILL